MVIGRAGGVGAGVAAATLVLGACGGTGATGADPSASPTAGEPSSTSPAASSVEPATGPQVRTDTFTVRLPEGFRVTDDGVAVAATGPSGDRMNLATLPLYADKSLHQLVDVAVGNGSWDSRPERLDDVVVDGVEMYHLSGPTGLGVTRDEVGAQTDATFAYADFDLRGPESVRRELIDSVLATWRWR